MRTKVIFFITALFVFWLDRFTKNWLCANMTFGETAPVIQDFFHLTLTRNYGTAFGLMQNRTWVFILSLVVIFFILFYVLIVQEEWTKPQVFGLGLVIGGAVGNLLDRVFYGAVIDFLDFRGIWPFIFNGADMAIVAGSFIFAFVYLRLEIRKEGI
jgi:signal peptidase II